MMSLQLLIVTSLLLLVFGVDESFGNFCDEGPPGRYCYKDLGGWYECKIDPATLKMTETKHDCPINTRCQCFYGPNCPSTVVDPCAKYELPPPFPDVFSTFYTVTITTCNNNVCSNVTNIGELLQDAKAGEQRHDTVGPNHWNTRFIFPFQYIENNDFIQFEAAWFERNCSLDSRKIFPRFEVPPYFTCDQSKVRAKKGLNATFKFCLWESGGHSKSEEVTIERWLLMKLRDGRYIPYSHEVQTKPKPNSNITVYYDTMYASFFPDFLDPSQLTMPSFCVEKAANFKKIESK